MTMTKQVNLSQMYAGQRGMVLRVDGGMGLLSRLSAMGIRPGKKITKVSSMLMRGPVTVQVGSTRLAIGFGMASRILVELEQ
jgi:ferrous iron transport protein A